MRRFALLAVTALAIALLAGCAHSSNSSPGNMADSNGLNQLVGTWSSSICYPSSYGSYTNKIEIASSGQFLVIDNVFTNTNCNGTPFESVEYLGAVSSASATNASITLSSVLAIVPYDAAAATTKNSHYDCGIYNWQAGVAEYMGTQFTQCQGGMEVPSSNVTVQLSANTLIYLGSSMQFVGSQTSELNSFVPYSGTYQGTETGTVNGTSFNQTVTLVATQNGNSIAGTFTAGNGNTGTFLYRHSHQ